MYSKLHVVFSGLVGILLLISKGQGGRPYFSIWGGGVVWAFLLMPYEKASDYKTEIHFCCLLKALRLWWFSSILLLTHDVFGFESKLEIRNI